MFSWKSLFFGSLLVVTTGICWLMYEEQTRLSGHWLKVNFKDPNNKNNSSLNHSYDEFWNERPDGIGFLKMEVKLIPDIEDPSFFLIGYKAEAALNSKALELEKTEPNCIYTSGEFEIGFWFSLLDEDEFQLDSINVEPDVLSSTYTHNFSDLEPNGTSQIEQRIITHKKIPSSLAKRIKKVKVKPFLKRNE